MDIDSIMATNLSIIIPQIHLGDDYMLPSNPLLEMVTHSIPGTAVAVTYVGLQQLTVYEDLLRSVQFINTEPEPMPGPRNILFQIFTSGTNGEFALSNVAESTITVLALNDQPPVFSQAVYFGSVLENQISGTSVGVTVDATDPDVHSQTTISYSIVGTSNYFSINPLTGVVLTTAQLDAEQLPSVVNLTVMAVDSDGNHMQSSTAIVSVSIVDINDNAPMFNQSTYLVSTLEDISSGSVIFTASANDLDRSSANSRVRYSLQETNFLTPNAGSGMSSGDIMSSSFPFQINHTTGALRVSDSLDYEQTRQYVFFIIATDTGSPSLSSSAEMTVEVEDINDNSPVFLGTPYTANVSEQAAVDSVVLSVQATDADSGSNAMIVFSIEGTTFFTIDPSSGEISLSSSVDHESQASHTFSVTAQDQGNPSMSSITSVQIDVLNENDAAPQFVQNNYTIVVRENSLFDDIQIRATDSDGDTISYLIVSQCIDAFSINPSTGILSQIIPLDREMISVCTVTVSAFDGLRTSDVKVYITVEDENDNSPSFNETSYSVTIPEIIPLGTTVVTVLATDRDFGVNAEITYSLEPANNMFAINSMTGAITVTSPLNFETIQSYSLTAVARDGGSPPPRSSSVPVMITVTDSNDNAPTLFISNPLTSYQEESGDVLIAQGLQVIDPDSSPLMMAAISFSLPTCDIDDDVNMVCAGNPACMELCGEGLMLNATLLGQLTVNYIEQDLQLAINITGSASTAFYQQLLSSLTYINRLEEPAPGLRSVNMVVQDGSSYSNVLQLNISVTLIDDNCPLVNSQSTSATYIENSSPLMVAQAAGLSISDADLPPHQRLSQLLIQLSGTSDGVNETIGISSPLPPTVSVSTQDNTITITGDAPVSVYQQLLQSLVYTNAQDEPTPGLRNILITPVQTGLTCTGLQLNLTVMLINDNAPQLLLQNATTLSYEEESGQLLFAQAAGLSISDADDSNLLSVNITLNGALDSESIQLTATLPSEVSSVEQTTTSIRLYGEASTSIYESLIRSASYENTALEPTPGNRSVTITVYDGVHNAASTVIVIVILRNDNPLQLSSNVIRFNFIEGGDEVLSVGEQSGITLSDDDQNGMVYNLTISLTSREPDREFIGAVMNGVRVNSSSSLTFNQPATVAVYQVSLILKSNF